MAPTTTPPAATLGTAQQHAVEWLRRLIVGGELVPGAGGIRVLSRPERAALLPLMLLGRLEIAPVLVGLGLAATGVRRVVQRGAGRGDTVG